MYTTVRGRLTVIVLATGAALVGFLFVQKIVRAQNRVPFTATTQHVVYERSGKARLTVTGLLAMRGDGSTVRAQNIARPDNTGVATQRFILDLARAEEVSLDDLTASKTTLPLSRASVRFYESQPMCTSTPHPVHAKMLGFDVVQNIKYIGDQSKKIMRREEWRAPALDCLALKQTLTIGSSPADAYTASSNEVLGITVGDPGAFLFDIPAGYVERSPTERAKELLARYPQVPYPGCAITSDQAMDELYYKRQTDKGQ